MTVPVIELRALVHDFGTVRAVDRLDTVYVPVGLGIQVRLGKTIVELRK